MLFADVIIDISHENLDRTFQYAVPEHLMNEIQIGSNVSIPFGKGNHQRTGYVVGLSTVPNYPIHLMKKIDHIVEHSLVIESQLIQLAYWIKEQYGATMNDALRTVIPIKKSVKEKEKKYIHLAKSNEEIEPILQEFIRKRNVARVRLLEALLKNPVIELSLAVNKLNISRSTIQDLEKMKFITISSEKVYRNPIKQLEVGEYTIELNEEQKRITDQFKRDYAEKDYKTYLIHGVTGSGKTEVYMEMIDFVIQQQRQVIMLIPEIALTYQTVLRFYQRFGDRISILNSKMSAGERYDQYMRAKNGEIDIMIGPRSALFTPFNQLGLILIDEEHEGSYKSESPPKYHAREVAIMRAKLCSASVVLGSATPSVEAYDAALRGEYQLFEMVQRAGNATLPFIWVIDLREELKARNTSIFSRKLKELILDRLEKKEQIMLFINRRGYAGFVSCRSCGHVMQCPHCDISLTAHNNGTLVCHYCGYRIPQPRICPECGSKYIAAFGTGTQKVEEMVKKEFPQARVLRMDMDTTSAKGGHEKILASFANQEADILVGTQMIVKGHDFSNVTLVGVVAADLSLYAADYRAAERTFQLLAQASGRAGRGKKKGEVVIQTYNPEQYSVIAAAKNDYKEFYQHEIAYRKLMMYPPVSNIMVILFTSKKEEELEKAVQLLSLAINQEFAIPLQENRIKTIGPTTATVGKVNDIYRFVLHVKAENYEDLKVIQQFVDGYTKASNYFGTISLQYDFNPMNGY